MFEQNNVCLTKDPYFNEDLAHGVALSVANTRCATPPSLKIFFDEMRRDLDPLLINIPNQYWLVHDGFFFALCVCACVLRLLVSNDYVCVNKKKTIVCAGKTIEKIHWFILWKRVEFCW